MKNIFAFIVCSFFVIGVQGRTFEFKDLGVKFELPANWDSTAVMEKNKPRCFFEAIHSGNKGEFITAITFTSKTRPVDESRLDAWTVDMTNGLGGENVKSQNIRIVTSSGIKWYSGIFKLDDKISFYCFCTYLNGYEYSIDFARQGTDKKTFEDEVNAVISSVVFDVPASFARVKQDIANAAKDATGFVMPAGFYLTAYIDRRNLSPYVYHLYKSLLDQHTTDLVMVSKVYADQLICLNIKKDMAAMGPDVLQLVSNMTADKMKQDGGEYEEVFVGVWDKAPDKVQLQKFRITKDGTKATVYIFYCPAGEGKTNVIKVQLPVSIENIFEPDIYQLILKNI